MLKLESIIQRELGAPQDFFAVAGPKCFNAAT
jgi:hypothetical protein